MLKRREPFLRPVELAKVLEIEATGVRVEVAGEEYRHRPTVGGGTVTVGQTLPLLHLDAKNKRHSVLLTVAARVRRVLAALPVTVGVTWPTLEGQFSRSRMAAFPLRPPLLSSQYPDPEPLAVYAPYEEAVRDSYDTFMAGPITFPTESGAIALAVALLVQADYHGPYVLHVNAYLLTGLGTGGLYPDPIPDAIEPLWTYTTEEVAVDIPDVTDDPFHDNAYGTPQIHWDGSALVVFVPGVDYEVTWIDGSPVVEIVHRFTRLNGAGEVLGSTDLPGAFDQVRNWLSFGHRALVGGVRWGAFWNADQQFASVSLPVYACPENTYEVLTELSPASLNQGLEGDTESGNRFPVFAGGGSGSGSGGSGDIGPRVLIDILTHIDNGVYRTQAEANESYWPSSAGPQVVGKSLVLACVDLDTGQVLWRWERAFSQGGIATVDTEAINAILAEWAENHPDLGNAMTDQGITSWGPDSEITYDLQGFAEQDTVSLERYTQGVTQHWDQLRQYTEYVHPWNGPPPTQAWYRGQTATEVGYITIKEGEVNYRDQTGHVTIPAENFPPDAWTSEVTVIGAEEGPQDDVGTFPISDYRTLNEARLLGSTWTAECDRPVAFGGDGKAYVLHEETENFILGGSCTWKIDSIEEITEQVLGAEAPYYPQTGEHPAEYWTQRKGLRFNLKTWLVGTVAQIPRTYLACLDIDGTELYRVPISQELVPEGKSLALPVADRVEQVPISNSHIPGAVTAIRGVLLVRRMRTLWEDLESDKRWMAEWRDESGARVGDLIELEPHGSDGYAYRPIILGGFRANGLPWVLVQTERAYTEKVQNLLEWQTDGSLTLRTDNRWDGWPENEQHDPALLDRSLVFSQYWPYGGLYRVPTP